MNHNPTAYPLQCSHHWHSHTDIVMFSTGQWRKADQFLSAVLNYVLFSSLLHQLSHFTLRNRKQLHDAKSGE